MFLYIKAFLHYCHPYRNPNIHNFQKQKYLHFFLNNKFKDYWINVTKCNASDVSRVRPGWWCPSDSSWHHVHCVHPTWTEIHLSSLDIISCQLFIREIFLSDHKWKQTKAARNQVDPSIIVDLLTKFQYRTRLNVVIYWVMPVCVCLPDCIKQRK